MDRPAIGSWDMLAAGVVFSGAAIASWEPECVRIRSRDDYAGKESQSTAALGTGRSGAAAAFSGHPCEAIRGFRGGDSDVLAHKSSLEPDRKIRRWFRPSCDSFVFE